MLVRRSLAGFVAYGQTDMWFYVHNAWSVTVCVADMQAGRLNVTQTDRQECRQAGRQAGKEMPVKQRGKQMESHAGKQMNRQMEI